MGPEVRPGFHVINPGETSVGIRDVGYCNKWALSRRPAVRRKKAIKDSLWAIYITPGYNYCITPENPEILPRRAMDIPYLGKISRDSPEGLDYFYVQSTTGKMFRIKLSRLERVIVSEKT